MEDWRETRDAEVAFGDGGSELWHALKKLLNGHDADCVLNVLCNALASAVIQSVDTPDEADELIDKACAQLKRAARMNWDVERGAMANRTGRTQ